MANDYAIPRNGAQWATPVPSTTTVDGKTQKAMDVTVGETVNNVFAVFLNANSTVVSAHAKARCEKTKTGCATWPLTLDMDKFTGLVCGESFVVSFDPKFATDGECPDGLRLQPCFLGSIRESSFWLA